MGTGGGDSAAAARDSPEAVPELSPEQLQLVQQHFDRVRDESDVCCVSQPHSLLGIPVEQKEDVNISNSENVSPNWPEATIALPDQVDREKSGILTPEAIHAFLADVGLEASPFDMRHIMAELDPEHTGIVSRSSFISFIRYGGQPVAPPKVSLALTIAVSCTTGHHKWCGFAMYDFRSSH